MTGSYKSLILSFETKFCFKIYSCVFRVGQVTRYIFFKALLHINFLKGVNLGNPEILKINLVSKLKRISKIKGKDVSDRINSGLAVNMAKLGNMKPVLTPEERLKEAKFNAECPKK